MITGANDLFLKIETMENFIISFVYIAFFGLIGFAVYYTESAAPLWALLLIPSVSFKSKK